MGAAQSSTAPARATSDMAFSPTDRADDASANESAPAPKADIQPITLTQHHEPYHPPTSPINPLAHYIFLVHGWLGNDLEMSYLSESFARCIANEGKDSLDEGEEHDAKRVKRSNSQLAAIDALKGSSNEAGAAVGKHPPVIVHSVKCNVGRTHDGIKNGGTRLAHEIVDFIRTDLQEKKDANSAQDQDTEGHVTYSIVGNSLGGLYARFAISLVPRQLSIPRPVASANNNGSSPNNQRITLHPNTFLTTATPHLGVSQHTYLPIPRIAETIIGSGMGTTGTDLFRLNSDKTGRENVIGAGVRKLSGVHGVLGPWQPGDEQKSKEGSDNNGTKSSIESNTEEEVDKEMECIIRSMCLQEKYLAPLRNFRRRIAYANAYRTDFQVPTETAAFLNPDSDVVHTVVACRDVKVEEGKHDRDESHVPPFVVAVVSTEQQSINTLQQLESAEAATPKEELLKMSKSLDALGWTKVFIDVRNRIPLPGIPKPSWRLLPFPSMFGAKLPEPDTPLDDLIHSRGYKKDGSSSSEEVEASKSAEKDAVVPTVTSSELIQSTNAGETVHFPMGHTVMVANSKSDTYTKLNYQGRPVMDKLAEDMLRDVLEFK